MKTAAYRAFFLTGAAAAILGGCRSSAIEVPKVPGVTPYRMVIQQGNFVSSEMVAQLRPGMTKEQVRFVLGTPLVNDIFHADRWDYVFYREMPNGKKEQRNLSVIFEKERLARVVGDLMPADGQVHSSGFEALIKPENDKPAAKPAAKAPAKPEAKPEAKAEAAPPAKMEGQTTQNWSTASEAPKPAAGAPKPAEAPKEAGKPEAPAAAQAEEKKERGFFGRMLEKIGL